MAIVNVVPGTSNGPFSHVKRKGGGKEGGFLALARAFLGGLADPKGCGKKTSHIQKQVARPKVSGKRRSRKRKSSKENGERESRDRVGIGC